MEIVPYKDPMKVPPLASCTQTETQGAEDNNNSDMSEWVMHI